MNVWTGGRRIDRSCGRRLALDVAMLRWRNSILRLRSREIRCTVRGFDRTIASPRILPLVRDLLFSNRRGSPLNERLVDTIVNTGGNSCKKFESLRSLEAESFLLPSPPSLSFSLSLFPFECSCFSYFSG